MPTNVRATKGSQANQITTITIADNYYFYMQWSAGKYIGGEELTMSTIASSGAVIHVRATCLLVGVVALLLVPLRAAATAHADTIDSKFLAVLKSEGITDHVSPSHAIEAAHTVCQKLDDGQTPSQVAADVLNSSSMPAYHSGYFVGASIDAYCPQYKSKIS